MGTSIVAMGMIKDIASTGDILALTCELTTPACPVKEKIESDIRARIAAVFPGVRELTLTMTGKVRASNVPTNDAAENLRRRSNTFCSSARAKAASANRPAP